MVRRAQDDEATRIDASVLRHPGQRPVSEDIDEHTTVADVEAPRDPNEMTASMLRANALPLAAGGRADSSRDDLELPDLEEGLPEDPNERTGAMPRAAVSARPLPFAPGISTQSPRTAIAEAFESLVPEDSGEHTEVLRRQPVSRPLPFDDNRKRKERVEIEIDDAKAGSSPADAGEQTATAQRHVLPTPALPFEHDPLSQRGFVPKVPPLLLPSLESMALGMRASPRPVLIEATPEVAVEQSASSGRQYAPLVLFVIVVAAAAVAYVMWTQQQRSTGNSMLSSRAPVSQRLS